jgi:hypothetical protein
MTKSSSSEMNGRQRLLLYILTVCAAALLCFSVYNSDRTTTQLAEPGSVAAAPRPFKSALQRSVQPAANPPVLLYPQPGANDSKAVLTSALDYTSAFHQVYQPHSYAVCPPPEGHQPCWLQLSKEVDCAALFDDYQKVLETHVPVFPAPRDLPQHLRDEFLLYNFTKISTFYFPQLSHAPNAEVPVWTNDTLKEYIIKAKARVQVGGYNKASLPIYQALDCHPVQGLTGAVFGTEKPWLEGMLFASGECHCQPGWWLGWTNHLHQQFALRQGFKDTSHGVSPYLVLCVRAEAPLDADTPGAPLLPLLFLHCPRLLAPYYSAGSGHITTIEFRTTVSHIPNHKVIKPLEWVQGFKAGTVPNVDYAFSFSSWEHDGLGRYGDPIDPWGDVKAVQRASCYVKPGEVMLSTWEGLRV